LHPETKAGAAGGLARQGSANEKSAFAESTADAIGKDESTIRPAAVLGDELDALAKIALQLAGSALLSPRPSPIYEATPHKS